MFSKCDFAKNKLIAKKIYSWAFMFQLGLSLRLGLIISGLKAVDLVV